MISIKIKFKLIIYIKILFKLNDIIPIKIKLNLNNINYMSNIAMIKCLMRIFVKLDQN